MGKVKWKGLLWKRFVTSIKSGLVRSQTANNFTFEQRKTHLDSLHGRSGLLSALTCKAFDTLLCRGVQS